ncbi:hypothetical protein Aduo_008345 [Ancylostoma duodenale]
MDVAEVRQVAVTSPHVRADDTFRHHMPLDDSIEVCRVVIVGDLHENELRSALDSSNEPVPANDAAHIVLPTNDVRFVDLHYCARSSDSRHVRGVVVDKYIVHESKVVGEEVASQEDLLAVATQRLEEGSLQVSDLVGNSVSAALAFGALELPKHLLTGPTRLLLHLPWISTVGARSLLPQQSTVREPVVELLLGLRCELRPRRNEGEVSKSQQVRSSSHFVVEVVRE